MVCQKGHRGFPSGVALGLLLARGRGRAPHKEKLESSSFDLLSLLKAGRELTLVLAILPHQDHPLSGEESPR